MVSAAVTQAHRETCDANASSWSDGASSFDEVGAETAPGAFSWVQARPMRPAALAHLPPVCGTSMEPLAHLALLCSGAQMSWRHDVIAETWQAICRDAGLSAHLKQKAEFPPGEFRRVSDVYCRGVAVDLQVHLDVVVTSSVHNQTGEWQIAGEGVTVAREERRKLREWEADEISGCTARLVPLPSRAKAAGDEALLSSWTDWLD